MEFNFSGKYILKDVLDKITENSWYTHKSLPLNEKVNYVKEYNDSFIIYFMKKNIYPVICSRVSKSSFRKYGKLYRVY